MIGTILGLVWMAIAVGLICTAPKSVETEMAFYACLVIANLWFAVSVLNR